MNTPKGHIVGHEAIIRSLEESIAGDKLSHALLLHGRSGYGSLAIALYLAQSLVCQDRHNGAACGECAACHRSSQYIHPDVHFAMPVVSKAGQRRDKTISTDYLTDWRSALSDDQYLSIGEWVQRIATQSARADINVAECNHIYQQLMLQSFESAAKVQIIWMAEYLGNNGNRLLKLIEEPPENTYIILICEDLDGVLGTIKSRCRTLSIPRIQESSIAHYLQHAHSLSPDNAEKVARISEGDLSIARGLVLIDNENLLTASLEMLVYAQRGDALGMKKWVDSYAGLNSQEQKAILAYILKLIREMLHSTVSGSDVINLSDAEVTELKKTGIASLISVDRAARLSDIISDTHYMIDRNAHTKTLMYDTCLKVEEVLRS